MSYSRPTLIRRALEHWIETGLLSLRCDRSVQLSQVECWCCGRKFGKAKKNGELANWTGTTSVEVCHIVPRQFGGKDTAENVVLMCRPCHDKAPDTTNKEFFLDWLREQTPWEYVWLSEAMRLIDDAQFVASENTIELSESGKLFDAIKHQIGLHAGRIKPSTIIGAIMSMQAIEERHEP